jgi:predicted amidophosphoribosyltransferase
VDGCRDCPPPEVALARSPFLFEGPARRAIHRLKFSGWRSVADALADAMVALGPPPADAVTWVPLARTRLVARGYDQARVLARAVAARTGVPAVPLLRRTTDTGSQARRRGGDRRAAMRGAFRPSGRPAPPTVLLVDDVLTTGATAAACAHALREAGALEIDLVTAARAFSGSLPPRYTPPTGPRPGLWLPGDVPR